VTSTWHPTQIDEIGSWRVVGDRLRHWARTDPDRPFLRCGGDWLTFGEFNHKTDRLASGLAEIGIAKGDRVAVAMPNREEALLSISALARLGAIQVPINPYLKGEFLRYQLVDSASKCIISDEPGLAEVARLRSGLPDLEHLICVDQSAPAAAIAFGELLDNDLPCPENHVVARDTLSIMYTSGTTGQPKGCVLSHGYYMSLPRGWFLSDWYRPDEAIITALPLFHIAGQGMVLMSCLQGGLRATFLTSFSASRFMAECRDAGATAAFGVGPMGMAVLASPPSQADRDHNLRISIFPPMSPQARDQFRERFGIGVVSQAYGQTECNPITLNPLDAHGSTAGYLGEPAPWLDLKLVDDDEKAVPDGEPGEIVIRPREPMVMFDGYWNNPAATVQASRELWHHTGDLAQRDDHGRLLFFDRKKDAIRCRGENISCVEVESAIGKHPDISAVATHAVPSTLGEDDLKAWIITERGVEFTPDELHAFLVAQLPYFAVPRYVQFVDAFPVNALNRVQKFKLRELGNDDAWDFKKLGMVITKEQRR
jgi:crotonobetaine/carnitine-CoA ligase